MSGNALDKRRTAELLIGRAPRIHWYSLFDLPKAWPATTRHREAEGSSYYHVFVDDRAVCFRGDFGETLEAIVGFRAHWEEPLP